MGRDTNLEWMIVAGVQKIKKNISELTNAHFGNRVTHILIRIINAMTIFQAA